MDFTVCGGETVSLGNDLISSLSSIPRKVFARAEESHSISISGQGFRFSSSDEDCPVTDLSVVQLQSDGSYAAHSALVQMKGGDALEFATSQAFETSGLHVKARTRSSSSFAYLPFQIKVCGAEQLTLAVPPIERSYNKLDRLRIIKDYQSFFRNSDPDECPIADFAVHVNGEPFTDEAKIRLDAENDNVKIYPAQFSDPDQDETLVIELVARTCGGVSARH